MNENRTFLGRGWSFPPALDKDGTPPPTMMMATEIQAVIRWGKTVKMEAIRPVRADVPKSF